jgi:tRNA (guanine37-N1)-methyltransferase
MAAWQARVLTIFPAMFPGPLGHSLAGKAMERGDWALEVLDIRDFAQDRHRSVDDTPFGGGAGMVMRPDVVDAALASVEERPGPVIHLSPRGRLLDQARVRALAAEPGATLLCGRYEGLDQRVLDARDAYCRGSWATRKARRRSRSKETSSSTLTIRGPRCGRGGRCRRF